jgi:hypothetical protein
VYLFLLRCLSLGTTQDVCVPDCSGSSFSSFPMDTHIPYRNHVLSRPAHLSNTNTKIHSLRQLAVLPLHCELHKLYREWQANAGYTALIGERIPHEDHGAEKRTWRTETHCCQRSELEPLVPTSLQPSTLEERN